MKKSDLWHVTGKNKDFRQFRLVRWTQPLIPDKSDKWRAKILFLDSEHSFKRDLDGKARVWGCAAGLFSGVLMRGGVICFIAVLPWGFELKPGTTQRTSETEMAPCFISNSSFLSFIRFQWLCVNCFCDGVRVWILNSTSMCAHTHRYMKSQACEIK